MKYTDPTEEVTKALHIGCVSETLLSFSNANGGDTEIDIFVGSEKGLSIEVRGESEMFLNAEQRKYMGEWISYSRYGVWLYKHRTN